MSAYIVTATIEVEAAEKPNRDRRRLANVLAYLGVTTLTVGKDALRIVGIIDNDSSMTKVPHFGWVPKRVARPVYKPPNGVRRYPNYTLVLEGVFDYEREATNHLLGTYPLVVSKDQINACVVIDTVWPRPAKRFSHHLQAAKDPTKLFRVRFPPKAKREPIKLKVVGNE